MDRGTGRRTGYRSGRAAKDGRSAGVDRPATEASADRGMREPWPLAGHGRPGRDGRVRGPGRHAPRSGDHRLAARFPGWSPRDARLLPVARGPGPGRVPARARGGRAAARRIRPRRHRLGPDRRAHLVHAVGAFSRPAAGRGEVRHVSGGWFDEEAEVWDATGRLVAQSRQIARVGRGQVKGGS